MDTKTPFASPVKEYTQETYVCDEDGRESLDSRTTWKYDEDHRLIEVIQHDPVNNFTEISTYTYDSDRNLEEVVVKVEDGEQKKAVAYEYVDGRLDFTLEAAGDYKIVTKYDDFGNPAEKQNFTRDDLLISTTMFVNQYDENGRLIEKHTIFPEGRSERVDKYQYNDAGLLIEEQNIRNQFVSTTKHSYNEQGDLILSDINPGEPNYEALKREITYSENGDIKVVREYRKGWCYEGRNDEFGLTGVIMFFYVR